MHQYWKQSLTDVQTYTSPMQKSQDEMIEKKQNTLLKSDPLLLYAFECVMYEYIDA